MKFFGIFKRFKRKPSKRLELPPRIWFKLQMQHIFKRDGSDHTRSFLAAKNVMDNFNNLSGSDKLALYHDILHDLDEIGPERAI